METGGDPIENTDDPSAADSEPGSSFEEEPPQRAPSPAPVLVPSAQVDASGTGILAGPAFATAVPLASGPAIPASAPMLEPSAVFVAAATRPPRVGETVSGALDLAFAASRRVRRASIYIGIVTLAIVGPAVILLLALIRDIPGDDLARLLAGEMTFQAADSTTTSMLGLAITIAWFPVIAITLEGQIMATAIVGGIATDRRIGLRRSLRLSRKVFWSIAVAAFLVYLIELATSLAASAIVGGSTGDTELASVIQVAVSTVATLPFVFYQAGIILGGVGFLESLRRSVRIARARWRLAVVVASAGLVLNYIELFALGAGLDIVFRVADAAGLGMGKSVPVTTITVVLILVCIVAVGSLLVTIAALVAAPQVFVFLKMTGYSAGLDRALDPVGNATAARPRLLTLPMLGAIVLGFVVALVGIAAT